MKKFFLLLAVPAVVLLFSCDPADKDDPEKPQEYDIEFTANVVEATAIPPMVVGMMLGIETDCHILSINMSDNGFNTLGFDMPNSTYFVASLLYDLSGSDGDVIKVADGTYRYVPGSRDAGNLVLEMSYYTKTGEAIDEWTVEYLEDSYFTDAVLTVSTEGGAQRFDFTVTLEDGRTARAVYTGDVSFDEIDPGELM